VPGPKVPPSLDQVRDLEVLIRAHHPLILVETVEDDRVEGLLEHVADRLGLALHGWRPHRGLVPLAPRAGNPQPGTESPDACLAAIAKKGLDGLFHLPGLLSFLEGSRALVSQLQDIHRTFFTHRGALVISGGDGSLPAALEPRVSVIDLEPPDDQAYYKFVSEVLRDLRGRMDVSVEMTPEDVGRLLAHLRGLTFFEVRKILTHAIVEDGRLTPDDLGKVMAAKKRIVERSGVLEFTPADERLADIAGLDRLKGWLRKRRTAFAEPARAREFGLSPPKGLFLMGVQGCGKSLCAKAVAGEWSLPLLRLDPSNLYQRYYGETEKNLRRAIRTAEQLAPVVLWIDEIEKAFGQGAGDGGDSGTGQRVFGTFLHWLAEKKESVFVLATANDVSRLPPELLRKGRFDEIFFVDLPGHEVREAIFRIHLEKRGRPADAFDLAALAEATVGFSGSEIEQVVVSALYTAFAEHRDLDTPLLAAEAAQTRPLSQTMREKVTDLRRWAADRTVPAH